MRSLLFFLFLSNAVYAEEYILQLENQGSVHYVYEDFYLKRIDRFSDQQELLYSHAYDYDEQGNLISEKLIAEAGEISYKEGPVIKTPLTIEAFECNDNQIVIKQTQNNHTQEYRFNHEVIAETPEENPVYDYVGNVSQIGHTYYEYDKDRRLIRVSTNDIDVTYEYDKEGRRIAKIANGEKEHYLFLGGNEIAIYDSTDKLKQLRIPGLSTHPNIIHSIAIETEDTIYAPIHDFRGNITKLIDIYTKEVIEIDHSDPFGRKLPKELPTPWVFAGKHYDKDTGLIYFGHRFYSPRIMQWLTPDPKEQMLFAPYLYCFHNPFIYQDPDGAWALTFLTVSYGAGVTIATPAWLPLAAGAAAGAAIGYLGYKLYENYQTHQAAKEIDRLFPELADPYSSITFNEQGLLNIPGQDSFLNRDYLNQRMDAYKANSEEYKKPKAGLNGKERSSDVPSWAEGYRPYKKESGKDFAKRILDEIFGPGNYKKGVGSDFNKIKKWGDRNFE